MTKKKLALGGILVLIGLLGVLSILTMELPLPPAILVELEAIFTPMQVKLLLLINPTLMLLVAVVLGTIFYERMGLTVPVLEKAIGLRSEKIAVFELIKFGVLAGIIAGILVTFITIVFNPYMPEAFQEISKTFKPTLAARFLYGGITEEVMMRFGIMTFLAWLASKIFSGKPPFVYWLAIVIAAVIFAAGHLPIVFILVENPTSLLIIYILLGNTIAGIIFGWLYWKKGLESAIVAHIFAHVAMLIAESFIA